MMSYPSSIQLKSKQASKHMRLCATATRALSPLYKTTTMSPLSIMIAHARLDFSASFFMLQWWWIGLDWTSLRHSSTCEELIECSPCIPKMLLSLPPFIPRIRQSFSVIRTKRVTMAVPVTADSDSVQVWYKSSGDWKPPRPRSALCQNTSTDRSNSQFSVLYSLILLVTSPTGNIYSLLCK